ncbi:MAG: lipid A biosynthesis lauroyl acyltransferase [Gammaproteobacteria bacterium]|nr:MAG: lipid A biosynthesis lauroyl acyltransferase [Gammaproteobacteria bacterium]
MAPRPTPERRLSLHLLHPRQWHRWLGIGVMRAFSMLPLPVLWACGVLLGEALYRLHRPRRDIALVNIRKCFPELGAREQQRLAKKHFRALGQTALDIGIAWWASPARLRRLVRVSGVEHARAVLEQGKNIILLAPHFLGLEIAGARINMEHPGCAVFRRVANDVMDAVMEKARTRFGAVLVDHNQPLMRVVRLVRSGMPLYYLPDQDAGQRSSTFVPFFGIATATNAVLGPLAKLTDALVVPCLCRQLPRGQGYEVILRPPLTDFPSDDAVADAARMNREIEGGVREMPEQYFWVHKRFKTRPPGEPDFYA